MCREKRGVYQDKSLDKREVKRLTFSKETLIEHIVPKEY